MMDKKKAAAALPLLVASLREVLQEHDPSGLFACHCPADEHDADIHRIISLLQRAAGPDDVAGIVESVMDGWRPKGECDAMWGAMAPAIWIAWSAFVESSR